MAADPNLTNHVQDDITWKVAGAIIAALWAGVIALIGILYNRDQQKFSDIFAWREDLVEPTLRSLPEKYVMQKACDRRHDELMAEVRHIRKLFERHMKLNGDDDR